MPFFSLITTTTHCFSATIWRMTIGTTSALRLFVLPLVYLNFFTSKMEKIIIMGATFCETFGIMGLTYGLSMSTNNLFEKVADLIHTPWTDPGAHLVYFEEYQPAQSNLHVLFFITYYLGLLIAIFMFGYRFPETKTIGFTWIILSLAYLCCYFHRQTNCYWNFWGILVILQYLMIFMSIFFTWYLLTRVVNDRVLELNMSSSDEKNI